MGYCMNQMAARFQISKSNAPKALAAIKALAGKETIGDSSGRHFSWVATDDFVNSNTLKEAMDAWRWSIEIDENTGDAINIYFNGEKLGDDTYLFEAIAPYVRAGSFIEMQGEDGCLWRWVFDGKTYREVSATITWD
jgi:hypothetical protein